MTHAAIDRGIARLRAAIELLEKYREAKLRGKAA